MWHRCRMRKIRAPAFPCKPPNCAARSKKSSKQLFASIVPSHRCSAALGRKEPIHCHAKDHPSPSHFFFSCAITNATPAASRRRSHGTQPATLMVAPGSGISRPLPGALPVWNRLEIPLEIQTPVSSLLILDVKARRSGSSTPASHLG